MQDLIRRGNGHYEPTLMCLVKVIHRFLRTFFAHFIRKTPIEKSTFMSQYHVHVTISIWHSVSAILLMVFKARSHIPTRLNSWVGSLSVGIWDRALQQQLGAVVRPTSRVVRLEMSKINDPIVGSVGASWYMGHPLRPD